MKKISLTILVMSMAFMVTNCKKSCTYEYTLLGTTATGCIEYDASTLTAEELTAAEDGCTALDTTYALFGGSATWADAPCDTAKFECADATDGVALCTAI